MEQQIALVSCCLQNSDNSCGLLLMPVYSAKPGQLWQLEHQINKSLASRDVNLDKQFCLTFDKKHDMRDGRPSMYPGRLLHGQHVNFWKCPWRNVPLVATGRTEPAKQVPGKSLTLIEDLSDEALPSPIAVNGERVTGGKKFKQIGDDAAQKLLEATLTDSEFSERTVVVLCDLSPGVGNVLNAYLRLRAGSVKTPLYYVGVCDNPTHEEWLLQTTVANTHEQFVENKLTIPGSTPSLATPPEAMLEVAPTRPTLNVLVWMRDAPNLPGCPLGVKFPKEMVDKWYSHPTHGETFRALYDEVIALSGTEESDQVSSASLVPQCCSVRREPKSVDAQRLVDLLTGT
jgi:hypothetical protein